MKIEIREEELTKLKNQIINLRAQVRNFKMTQKTKQSKEAFNDTEKLIILEGVLLRVLDTKDQSSVTRLVLSNFSNDEFWEDQKNESIEEIIQVLKRI